MVRCLSSSCRSFTFFWATTSSFFRAFWFSSFSALLMTVSLLGDLLHVGGADSGGASMLLSLSVRVSPIFQIRQVRELSSVLQLFQRNPVRAAALHAADLRVTGAVVRSAAPTLLPGG